MRRQTVVAVPLANRRAVRLRAGLLGLTAAALLGAGAGPSPALADDPAAGTAGAAAAATEVTLREGDRGRAVRRLQRKLGVPADGAFGPQTERAVKRFQRRNGLTADGIVGPLTRGKLGLARFSAAEVRHPSEGGGAGGNSPVKLPRVLREIAECESGGDPRAVSPNGLYRGKFQFSRETWKGVGGRGDDPAKAPEAHQDRMALRLYKRSGVAPWPACGARATS